MWFVHVCAHLCTQSCTSVHNYGADVRQVAWVLIQLGTKLCTLLHNHFAYRASALLYTRGAHFCRGMGEVGPPSAQLIAGIDPGTGGIAEPNLLHGHGTIALAAALAAVAALRHRGVAAAAALRPLHLGTTSGGACGSATSMGDIAVVVVVTVMVVVVVCIVGIGGSCGTDPRSSGSCGIDERTSERMKE